MKKLTLIIAFILIIAVTKCQGSYLPFDSVSDPDAKWVDDEKAIDGDTGTFSHTTIPVGETYYLIFDIPGGAPVDKVRIWQASSYCVCKMYYYTNGVGTIFWSDGLAPGTWHEKELDGGAIVAGVTQIKVAYYNDELVVRNPVINEIDYNLAVTNNNFTLSGLKLGGKSYFKQGGIQ